MKKHILSFGVAATHESLLSFPASWLHSASSEDLENGVAVGSGDKVGQRCVRWDRKSASENETA